MVWDIRVFLKLLEEVCRPSVGEAVKIIEKEFESGIGCRLG
jgi:hypothetical protein